MKRLMMGKRRMVLLSVVGVMVATAYGFLLHAVTEPWRVWGNDHRPLYWAILGLLGIATIVIVSIRWPRCWPLVGLLVPLFLVSRQQIINGRLSDSITSCGNHSKFWSPHFFDRAALLPDSTEFADFLLELKKDELAHHKSEFDRLRGSVCPGYKLTGTKTGVVFVGGGLRPAALRDPEVLIAFCSWKCHPIPYDHQHVLVWWPGVNEADRGGFQRECSETKDMIGRIERALKQADDGVVPYSRAARVLLEEELEMRRSLMDN